MLIASPLNTHLFTKVDYFDLLIAWNFLHSYIVHGGTQRTVKDTRKSLKQGVFQLDVRKKTESGEIHGGSLEDISGMSAQAYRKQILNYRNRQNVEDGE